LEPRVDALAALFLPQLLQNKLNAAIRSDIIPEFPLRRGTLWDDSVPGRNKSKKVDFALCSEDRQFVHFVEFKTDQTSRNDEQDEYLSKAVKLPFSQLLDGVVRISKATLPQYLPKYQQLMLSIEKWGFALDPLQIHRADSTKVVRWYLQPQPGDANTIGFADFATFLRTRHDSLAVVLAPYFQRWVTAPTSPAV
jgi:hypothetical protein